MTRYALALTALDEIKRLAAETRAKHPAITDDLLLDGGEIRYMNGMRGTENTWINLGMTCDFVIFYQSWPNFAFIRFPKKTWRRRAWRRVISAGTRRRGKMMVRRCRP